MKRASLYSSSRAKAVAAVPVPGPKKIALKSRIRESLRKNRVPLLAATPGLAALFFVLFQWGQAPARQQLTQEDIDAAVTRAIESVPLPSVAAKAYEAVHGSIVRVRAFMDGPDGGEVEGNVGTGVVILDTGVILTHIHVVAGAKRISLTFSDGLESAAVVTGTRPEDDLAVLQAQTLPDDLQDQIAASYLQVQGGRGVAQQWVAADGAPRRG